MLTRAVAYLEPGKTIQIEVEAEAGALYGFSIDGDAGFLLPIDPALPASEQKSQFAVTRIHASRIV